MRGRGGGHCGKLMGDLGGVYKGAVASAIGWGWFSGFAKTSIKERKGS